MDMDDTIQVRSFSFDLFEALKTLLKLCSAETSVAQICERYLRLDVRSPPLTFLESNSQACLPCNSRVCHLLYTHPMPAGRMALSPSLPFQPGPSCLAPQLIASSSHSTLSNIPLFADNIIPNRLRTANYDHQN